MSAPTCRFCAAPLATAFADLGMTPLSNAFLAAGDLAKMERFYPLQAWVCGKCFLVQLDQFEAPEQIFSADYAYFSSYSESWLDHCRRYADATAARFGLGAGSLVTEVASNDGYLLQFFAAKSIPVLGIEPAANVAAAAKKKGIRTVVRFLGADSGKEIAAEHGKADLVAGNNVFAHVPDLNDFARGLAALLKPQGVLTLEFPHLLRLMQGNQFDTIYHEHFSYFSLLTARQVLAAHGLEVFDVEELPTHGGSLRIYAQRTGEGKHGPAPAPERVIAEERRAGLDRFDAYRAFAEQVKATKRALLRFLLDAREQGKKVVAYGAPAKGNTLLNYCGVRTDLIDYTVDLSPHKQGKYLPGTHIPIHAPARIAESKPDYVLILPWNIKDEIVKQMAHIRGWGGKFVVPIPRVEVLP
jgi:2-polyprenyl-3-methyl-5-hydroxy-6-metoxy-1,4-benzoquinol methylase